MALTLLALTLGGCERPIPILAPDARFHVAGKTPFERALQRWIRSGKLYRNFDTILLARVLYRSAEVRVHFVAQLARSRLLTASERRELVAKEAASRSEREFIMAVSTGEAGWNDFDKKDSMWSLRLELPGGRRVAPKEIRRFRLDPEGDPLLTLYPFIGLWDTVYSVRFPLPPGAVAREEPIKLIISSVLGRLELLWGEAS
ncbi:MAG: hypothetical protein ACE5JJ_09455 [Nitrospinota bacterium]